MSSVDNMEKISLSFQMLASIAWAVGAALAGPASVADYLQFFAALFWCASNVCAGITLFGIAAPALTGANNNGKNAAGSEVINVGNNAA